MAPSTTMLVLAIFFGVVGFAGVHMVERRRFYRRNHAAVEEFRNYTQMAVTKSFEGLLHGVSRLLLAAAVGLFCMFGIVRCSENDARTQRQEQIAPPLDKSSNGRVLIRATHRDNGSALERKDVRAPSMQHPGQ